MGADFLKKNLKNTRYQRSGKSFKVKKQCNFKTLRKNYKASSVKRVWVEKKNSKEFRPLGIPTLRDRVLQQIIVWAIYPIAEFQADCLSFGFRKQRSCLQAISFISR